MAKSDTGVLAVVAGGKRVGVISERDVVRAVAHGADLRAASVGSYPTTPEMAASLDDETTVVARRMLATGVRRLPVVGQAGEVVGMVSMRDLFPFETAA
jgi:CBS domain-containing protein